MGKAANDGKLDKLAVSHPELAKKLEKKPVGAYMVFSLEQRAKIKEASPELSMPDVAKELGKRWRELDDQGKAPYEAKARKAKEEYEAARAEAAKLTQPAAKG